MVRDVSLHSKIEWTDATWNPWRGCSKVSAGCANCYAERESKRFGKDFSKIVMAADKTFYAPLGWKDPLKIFVCSGSDFFHEGADEWREHAWHTIYDTPHHTYQLLTKRPERIEECLPSFGKKEWPWPNVHLGITAENQEQLEKRWGNLSMIQAAVWFLSLEPLIGQIDFERAAVKVFGRNIKGEYRWRRYAHWIIVGGESGPKARPMHPVWARSVRDQCQAAGVPFFFKQWGEWVLGQFSGIDAPGFQTSKYDIELLAPGIFMKRVGKKKAGRLLDGRTWDEMPS